MPRTYPATPLWVKLGLAALAVSFVSWWALQRADRVGNEHRLGVIASQIVGHEVEVQCPGPVWRLIGWDSAEGKVWFENGKPASETKLSERACAELDALAEGQRGDDLACIERTRILCGRNGVEVAMAVDTLTHESFHMSGIADEAETECHSLHKLAWTAQQLGATAAQGAAMAVAQYDGTYQHMGDAYRGPCDRPA